ncbi:hypothetical protein EV421DRAFT_756616 [Armillaria borealis]|uniref:Uncharacterized protein n=1 Tax=Armillaria borealis TaxID=47425 RepID=A0AA39JEW6_9AGAR|nr:hypothetical protein EV421DRAFT_756616 [Armillaria borealis]
MRIFERPGEAFLYIRKYSFAGGVVCFYRVEKPFSTDALSSAPSLRRVDLEMMKISQLPVNAGLLTHFSGTFRRLADIQYIVQIPTLVEILIMIADDPNRPLESDGLLPIRMEKLQFLSVNDIRILDVLTAPSLRKFDYWPTSISNEGDTAIHSLRDFLARSACSIDSLGICAEMVQDIHHLMAFAKNISHLAVHYPKGRFMPSLDPLTLPETLPMMKRLRLSITDADWGERYAGGIIDVIRQRFDEERAAVLNITRLSSLRIDCANDSRAEFIDQLKGEGLDALEEEGLGLEKKSPYLRVDEYWTGSWFT